MLYLVNKISMTPNLHKYFKESNVNHHFLDY